MGRAPAVPAARRRRNGAATRLGTQAELDVGGPLNRSVGPVAGTIATRAVRWGMGDERAPPPQDSAGTNRDLLEAANLAAGLELAVRDLDPELVERVRIQQHRGAHAVDVDNPSP